MCLNALVYQLDITAVVKNYLILRKNLHLNVLLIYKGRIIMF